jgi:hypothetical protein
VADDAGDPNTGDREKPCTASRRIAVTMDRDALDARREHWQATFEANPNIYGIDPSQPGEAHAAELFTLR